jgi:hypothetical protein
MASSQLGDSFRSILCKVKFWRTAPLTYLNGQNGPAVDGPQRGLQPTGETLLRRVKFAFKPTAGFADLERIELLAWQASQRAPPAPI